MRISEAGSDPTSKNSTSHPVTRLKTAELVEIFVYSTDLITYRVGGNSSAKNTKHIQIGDYRTLLTNVYNIYILLTIGVADGIFRLPTDKILNFRRFTRLSGNWLNLRTKLST